MSYKCSVRSGPWKIKFTYDKDSCDILYVAEGSREIVSSFMKIDKTQLEDGKPTKAYLNDLAKKVVAETRVAMICGWNCRNFASV